jgi:hypothetical protein
MVEFLFALLAITFPVALDKFGRLDRLTYGILSTIFGWLSAIFFMMYMLGVYTK